MPPRKQRQLKANPATVVHRGFFQPEDAGEWATPKASSSAQEEQQSLPQLEQLNLCVPSAMDSIGSTGDQAMLATAAITTAAAMLSGGAPSASASAEQLQQEVSQAPTPPPIMVSDEDVQSFSTRTTQHIRALWKIMCSTIDIIHNPAGAAQIGCQDTALFHACAYQHQRLSGEHNLRRPENFFLHRQVECPFQCPAHGVGCGGCLHVKFVLDDWCCE